MVIMEPDQRFFYPLQSLQYLVFVQELQEVQIYPSPKPPIVPVQIADREYRLWLRSTDNRVLDNNGEIELSIHFQQPPYGLDRVEYDSEGSVTGFWYKPTDGPELEYVREINSDSIPKELQFDWYMAKDYLLKPNATNVISNVLSENVPTEITAGLEDSNDFLLTILEKMQTELKGKSA